MNQNRLKTPKKVSTFPQEMQDEYHDIMSFLKSVRQLNENNYLYQLRYRFINVMEHFASKGMTSIKNATYEDYIDFIQSTVATSSGRYRVAVDAVKKMNEWSYHKGYSGPDTLVRLSLVKTPKLYHRPEPAPFSDEEISKVFENIEEKFPYDPMGVDKLQRGMNTRDIDLRKSLMNMQLKALVWLMLETGCRISEAYPLTADDLDPINETIVVMGKYSKWREIPYSDLLREKIQPWLAHRKLITTSDVPNLWLALWGQNPNLKHTDCKARPVAYETFYGWGSYLVGETSSTNKGVTKEAKGRWHRFRKTFATRSNEMGLDIGVGSKVLGHSNTAVTMRYIGIDKRRVIAESKLVEGGRADSYKNALSDGQKGQHST